MLTGIPEGLMNMKDILHSLDEVLFEPFCNGILEEDDLIHEVTTFARKNNMGATVSIYPELVMGYVAATDSDYPHPHEESTYDSSVQMKRRKMFMVKIRQFGEIVASITCIGSEHEGLNYAHCDVYEGDYTPRIFMDNKPVKTAM